MCYSSFIYIQQDKMDNTTKNKDRVRVTTRSMSTPEDLLSTETNDPDLAPGSVAPGSVAPGVECGAAMFTADPLITPKEINQHFQTATKNFELVIKKASEKFLEEIREIEENINTALNIERERIDEIEKKKCQSGSEGEQNERWSFPTAKASRRAGGRQQ